MTAPGLVRLLGAWSGRGPAYRDLAAAVHLLVLEDLGGLEQLAADGDAALVVEVGVGDGGPVDLRLEKMHTMRHGSLQSRP